MKYKKIEFVLFLFTIVYTTSYAQNSQEMNKGELNHNTNATPEMATFGSGCFWCTEAVFKNLQGVLKVVSGYSGGHIKNPSYEEVCNGNTGHAEVCQITYNPSVISYIELLDVFWNTHDPTMLNRQGNDIGSQYRSVIYYHNETQKTQAEDSKKQMDRSNQFMNPIVTEISPLINFYPAEDYHQDYFEKNPNQTYCRIVINPKVKKFKAKYSDRLK